MSRKVNIQVAVRLRPTQQPHRIICTSEKDVVVKPDPLDLQSNQRAIRNYRFDRVFGPEEDQSRVYENARVSELVKNVLDGYNSTIFAYGQTGAGKTYTMQGYEYDTKKLKPIVTVKNEGVVPRCIRQVFRLSNARTSSVNGLNKKITIRLSCTFLQIYNQRIYDLFNNNSLNSNNFNSTFQDLSKASGLKMRWDKENQFSVDSLENRSCTDEEQMLKVWSEGLKNRFVASHRINMASSRSHTIFSIKVEYKDQNEVTTMSKLELVDLAGSERMLGEGKLARQSIDINKSLFALRKVISSLYNKESYVPYRESKLTSLLKNTIGGNSYCLILACLNPADRFVEQSISTLNYASQASHISNIVEKVTDKKDKLIDELRKENQQLREELKTLHKEIELMNRLESGAENSKTNKQEAMTKYAEKTINKYKEQIRSDYEYFGQRLVESINTVRELLKSNKLLRESLDEQKSKCEEYALQIEQLIRENQILKSSITSNSANTMSNYVLSNTTKHIDSRHMLMVEQIRGDLSPKRESKYESVDKGIMPGVFENNILSRPGKFRKFVHRNRPNRVVTEWSEQKDRSLI